MESLVNREGGEIEGVHVSLSHTVSRCMSDARSLYRFSSVVASSYSGERVARVPSVECLCVALPKGAKSAPVQMPPRACTLERERADLAELWLPHEIWSV